MAVAVAPLTTTVLSAVPTHRAGVASGINNAAAALANLLAVAVLGAVALGAYDRELDRHLAAPAIASEVKAAPAGCARKEFVAEPALAALQGDDRQSAEAIARAARPGGNARGLWHPPPLARARALCAAVTIPAGRGPIRAREATPGAEEPAEPPRVAGGIIGK